MSGSKHVTGVGDTSSGKYLLPHLQYRYLSIRSVTWTTGWVINGKGFVTRTTGWVINQKGFVTKNCILTKKGTVKILARRDWGKQGIMVVSWYPGGDSK